MIQRCKQEYNTPVLIVRNTSILRGSRQPRGKSPFCPLSGVWCGATNVRLRCRKLYILSYTLTSQKVLTGTISSFLRGAGMLQMNCTTQTSAPFAACWSPANVVRPPRRSERRRPAGSGATALRLLKLADAARL